MGDPGHWKEHRCNNKDDDSEHEKRKERYWVRGPRRRGKGKDHAAREEGLPLAHLTTARTYFPLPQLTPANPLHS